MSTWISGITLYRPSTSVSRQYSKDSDGNTIGHTDTVSVTDTVLSTDISGLLGVFDTAISGSMNPRLIRVDYPNNSGTYGSIKSVSASNESDFVNKLIYTIVIDAIPLVRPYSIYSGIADKRISSLTQSESWDVPYDMVKIVVPTTAGSGVYYNKPITYNYTLQVSCGITNTSKPKDNADEVLKKLGRTSPSSGLVDLSDYRAGRISSINKSSSEDGTQSLNVTTLYLPSGATDDLLVTEEVSESVDKLKNVVNRSYKITFKAIEGQLAVSTGINDIGFKVTGIGDNLSDSAYTAAENLLNFFIDNSGITVVSGNQPGFSHSCQNVSTLPKLTQTGCWNTKSVYLEKNVSDNSATLSIEQTTENIGNCDLNSYDSYTINYNVVKKTQSKAYYEVPGWSSTGYWVQDYNTFKDVYYDYSIEVSSNRKCSPKSTGIIDIAKDKLDEILIIPTGSSGGILTSYTINASADKCSLRVTQHSGVNQSTSGIGFDESE